MSNLAWLYEDQGRYQEAEELYKELMEKEEAIYGKEHNHTIACIANLISIYHLLDKEQEAKKLSKIQDMWGRDCAFYF